MRATASAASPTAAPLTLTFPKVTLPFGGVLLDASEAGGVVGGGGSGPGSSLSSASAVPLCSAGAAVLGSDGTAVLGSDGSDIVAGVLAAGDCGEPPQPRLPVEPAIRTSNASVRFMRRLISRPACHRHRDQSASALATARTSAWEVKGFAMNGYSP